MSKFNHQKELERLYSNNELLPRMRQFFIESGVIPVLEKLGIEEKLGLTVLVQMALHKRCNVATLVGLTKHLFKSAQECANALDSLVMTGLVQWDDNLRLFITSFTIPEDVQQELDRFQFPLPMVVIPRFLRTNSDTGYLVSGSKGSVILRDNHHEEDVCLDHLNRMNQIKLTLDLNTAVMVSNKWKNLDKHKEGESKEKYEKRVRAFTKYNQNAYSVFATLLKEENEFHLTHKYDKRGRTYCQGYYVNYQGTEWNRAVVQFADAEVILE